MPMLVLDHTLEEKQWEEVCKSIETVFAQPLSGWEIV